MLLKIKKQLAKIILQEYKIKILPEEIVFSKTPNLNFGDIAFNTYRLARKIKEDPFKIAKTLSTNLKIKDVEISVKGAYINFKFETKDLILLAKEILKLKVPKNKKLVLIEFLSPNTNKPLHLGHLRNLITGEVISRIYEAKGYNVKRLCLFNDRGIHIIKPIVSYITFHKKEKLENLKIKGDKYIGNLYTEFSKKSKKDKKLVDLAYEYLKKWEQSDKYVINLWKKFQKLAVLGIKKTLNKLGIKFDKLYFESKIYLKGKDIVEKMFKKRLVYKTNSGAYEINLEKYGLGKKILIRKDGTCIYITCDLALAVEKLKDFPKFYKSIYITGREQEYYFKVLFKILEIFGFKKVENYIHISYGMVNLPSGKMKSREGSVVEIDEFLEEIIELIKQKYPKSKNLSKKEIFKIAKASIIVYFLKVNPKKDIVFYPEKSISLKGSTGPYILYSYVRCLGILNRVKNFKSNIKKYEDISVQRKVYQKILLIDYVLNSSLKNYDPSIILNFLIEICKEFNLFYEKYKIINEKDKFKKQQHIEFVKIIKILIEKLSDILWIDLVRKM